MKRLPIVLVAAAVSVAACAGFKDAMTAQSDTVARAGSQQLSVERLADMLGKTQVPLSQDVVKRVAGLWVNYELLAQAAARGDSLNDPKAIDAALWPFMAQSKMAKWYETVSKTFPAADTANGAARYAQGDLLAARHILLLTNDPNMTPAKKDSVRRKAEAIRKDLTSANFASVAEKTSQDPQSAARGGDLGVFPRGAMVKQFEDAVVALKPGEISPPIETQYGYHIIRRSTYDEVAPQFAQAIGQEGAKHADSAYIAKLEQSGQIKFKDNAAAAVRGIAKDFDAAQTNNTVIATSKAGDFTVGRLAQWISVMPPQSQMQVMSGLQQPQLPDSLVIGLAKNFVRQELILRQADSAKVKMDSSELNNLHTRFTQLVEQSWAGLGVSPKTLADSAKTVAERERFASTQVDRYLEQFLSNPGAVQFVEVPAPVQTVLRKKYDWKLNQAGLDRVLQQATRVRAHEDSLKAASRPPSQVPLGAPPAASTDSAKAAPTKAPVKSPTPAKRP